MATPKEIAAKLYPEQQFYTNFEIYQRVMTDIIETATRQESVLDSFPASTIGIRAVEAVARHQVAAIRLAIYDEAYLAFMEDEKNNNRQGLYEIVYDLAERTDPIQPQAPVEGLGEHHNRNPVLIDSLKRIPRTQEGLELASVARIGEWTDLEVAQSLDRIVANRANPNEAPLF